MRIISEHWARSMAKNTGRHLCMAPTRGAKGKRQMLGPREIATSQGAAKQITYIPRRRAISATKSSPTGAAATKTYKNIIFRAVGAKEKTQPHKKQPKKQQSAGTGSEHEQQSQPRGVAPKKSRRTFGGWRRVVTNKKSWGRGVGEKIAAPRGGSE